MSSTRRTKRPAKKPVASGRGQRLEAGTDAVSKALTVRQPWAALIAAGLKTIENRSWQRQGIVGKWIAIHAGKATPSESTHRGRAGKIARAENPRGAIVCTAVVNRFVTSSKSSWFFGPIGWVLTDIRPCTPIPCSGALGLWSLPRSVAKRLGRAA